MEYNRRKGAKTKLRISAVRKKCTNLAKFNSYRSRGLPFPRETNSERVRAVLSPDGMQEDISSAPIESAEPDLPCQSSKTTRNLTSELTIDGLRIINLQHFIESLKKLSSHSTLFGCTLANMQVVKEAKIGYQSKLTFKCDFCNFSKIISTCPENPKRVDINTAAIAAKVNITKGMDIPSLSFSLYKKLHKEVCQAWEVVAWNSMKEAAEEEKQIALECGSVDVNGVPMITVVCDGSWAKRSYRSGGNYNSLSGTAAIVGLKTKKILFLGVKNKYCCVCQRAQNLGEEVASHTCYKNWNLSSTAMEANIIAEGFCSSLKMYNLIYNKMIADGDSSCYKKILDSRPYETCTVQKIECTNHLLRNYCNKLKKVSKSKGLPGAIKQVIHNNVLRCRMAVAKAVQFRRKENSESEENKIKNLRKDICNSVSHVFGEHKYCSELKYFCQKTQSDTNNYMSDFRILGFEEKLMQAVRYLASHSRSLLENVNTNLVEQFNSIIAQKLGGKRVNYTLRQSYQGRCFSAVVSTNLKKPLYNIHKHLSGGNSPGRNIKIMELQKLRINEQQKNKAKKRLHFTVEEAGFPDNNYGQNCEKPDLEPDSFNDLKDEFIKSLNKTIREYEDIEKNTRLQVDSTDWQQHRRRLLTASYFGNVCKMRSTTSCSSTVKSILYKEFFSKATTWGKNNEETAIKELETKLNLKFLKCGLFINSNYPYLGASPDGIEKETDCLLEIKCPYSAKDLSIKEAIEAKKIPYLKVEGDTYILNKNHNYFYQVQGQLNIAEKEICYFAVWTLKEIICIKIEIDKTFFNDIMVSRLQKFYFNCLLPEIIDPRHIRGMKIRDPDYILEAQCEQNKKK